MELRSKSGKQNPPNIVRESRKRNAARAPRGTIAGLGKAAFGRPVTLEGNGLLPNILANCTSFHIPNGTFTRSVLASLTGSTALYSNRWEIVSDVLAAV